MIVSSYVGDPFITNSWRTSGYTLTCMGESTPGRRHNTGLEYSDWLYATGERFVFSEWLVHGGTWWLSNTFANRANACLYR